MFDSTARSHEEHGEIRLLLPWYVNASLGLDEQRRVDEHLGGCIGCRHEIAALRRLAEACAQPSGLELAAEVSFAKLATRLPHRVQGEKPHGGPRFRFAKFKQWRGVSYALAASLTLAIIPFVVPRYFPTYSWGSFRTLSSVPAPARRHADLRVVFRGSVSETEIAAILRSIHGERVGRINSAGAIDVALDTSNGSPPTDRAIALLRMHADVVLAEPVMPP